MKNHFTPEEHLFGWVGVDRTPVCRSHCYQLIDSGDFESIIVIVPGSKSSRGKRLVSIRSVTRFFEKLAREQKGQKPKPILRRGEVMRGKGNKPKEVAPAA